MGVTGLKVKQKCKLFYTLGVYILQSIEIIFRLTEFSNQSKHTPWCKRFFVFLLQPKQTQPNIPTQQLLLIPASSCYFQCTTHKSICATCITLERQYNYFYNFLQITRYTSLSLSLSYIYIYKHTKREREREVYIYNRNFSMTIYNNVSINLFFPFYE